MTRLLAAAGLTVLALAAAGCDGAGEPGPTTTTTVPARAAPSTAPPTPTPSTVGGAPAGWPEFASVQGGYRLRHPPGWRVRERAGDGGPVLSLLPPAGAGISVLVTFTVPPEAGAASLPNTRCRPVRVGRLAGSRCLDTISGSVTTVLRGRDRWFVLTTSTRRPAAPKGAYDRVVASLRPG
jgi:hypothetical protein